VTIGIVGTSPIAQSDVDAFRAQFGLPATTITQTLVPDTGSASTMGFGGGLEAILDVEWSGGIAKGAKINYVFVGSTDFNVDDATFYLIEENLAPVMSESYGGCEAGILPSDADVTEEMGTAGNLMGITHTASAGDDGASDCGGPDGFGGGGSGLYVDIPGAFPGVTSVGGTQFPSPLWSDQATLVDAGLEQVWNEVNNPYSVEGLRAGGGGISLIFPRPAYQSGVSACAPVGTLPTPITQPMRQVPDVSMSAAVVTPGYFIECTLVENQFGFSDCSPTGGDPQGMPVGGTSAASPTFAAVVAILNEAVGDRLGNINPVLYQLESQTPGAFHDITSGNNEIVCGPGVEEDAGEPEGGEWPDAGCGPNGLYGYAAGPGYDCASGIGSIDAYNFVSAWLGAAQTDVVLVPSPTMTTEGDTVTLTATVSVVGTNTNALGGDVTFAFQSYDDSCGDDLSWELGSATITNGTSTGGAATLQAVIPPGLVIPGHQAVDLVALYGGDANHLPSRSAKVSMPFEPVTFAITPATLSTQPNGSATLATTGGITPPVRWFIETDTTEGFSMASGFTASSIDESSGAFTAGGNPGYVVIQALDKYGAEAVAHVTVGSPTATPPWAGDAGVSHCVPDAGVAEAGTPDAGADATAEDSGSPSFDSGAESDAGTPGHSAGSSGCSCEAGAGAATSSALASGGLAALGIGLGARRRRSRRASVR
jgi:hypothetical protein